MAQETYIVAYEGKGRGVINFAAERAQRNGARLHVVHVLEWSPYAFLTMEELHERHQKREEEIKRGHEQVLDPIVAELRESGIETDGEMRHGSPADVLIDIARGIPHSMIFVGRHGHSSVAARLLGSVSIGLAQSSPVPVVIVP